MNFQQLNIFLDNCKCRARGDLSNHERRMLFCDIEQTLLTLEEYVLCCDPKSKDSISSLKSEFHTLLINFTNLKRAHRSNYSGSLRVMEGIDVLLRFLSIWLFVVVSAIFFAFPCILLRPLDYVLIKTRCISPKHQISNFCKCFIATTFLKLFGTHLEVDNSAVQHMFGEESALICFTHASSLDAFILAASIPVKHFSLVSLLYS